MSDTSFGPSPISQVEAEAFLDKHTNLQKSINRTPKVLPASEELKEFLSGEENAFLFDKESILSLIKEKDADHILIALGAHNIDDPVRDIKAGSFTVMAIGYKQDLNFRGTGRKFNIVTNGNPAIEYPPKITITSVAAPTYDDAGGIGMGIGNGGDGITDPIEEERDLTPKPNELLFEKGTGSLFTL